MRRASIRMVESETGSVIVMVALTLVVLLGFLALGIDLGMLFAARTDAQRAADAAALSGASAFVDNPPAAAVAPARARATERSEEHTSELQSPCNLVCRLLLEKKKKINNRRIYISHTHERNRAL